MALRVALIGLSGAGKTTVAPLVAARLGFDWVDLDQAVERAAGTTVSELFRVRGEDAFRALEAEALERGLEDPRPGLVIACGGGVLARPESRERLRRNAFTVWLRVDPAEAAGRLGASGAARRPLLALGVPKEALEAALRTRSVLYRGAADAVVETGGKTPEQVADLVAALVPREGLG